MANLTISVDDDIIKRARVRAIQQGTSLSAKVREFLRLYVHESEDALKKQREDAANRLMQAIESATAQTQPDAAMVGTAARKRRTLRESLYAGEFRARDRPAARAARAK
jgi:plasmid stability protein